MRKTKIEPIESIFEVNHKGEKSSLAPEFRAPFGGHHFETPNQPLYLATILKDSLRIGGISFQTSRYFIWVQFKRSSFEEAIMRGSLSK